MKKFSLAFLFVLFCVRGSGQNDNFRLLNPQEISTGILHEKAIHFVNWKHYTGVSETDRISDFKKWKQSYLELFNCQVNRDQLLPYLTMTRMIDSIRDAGKIPLLITHVSYNRIKDSAFIKNLLRYDSENVVDVKGRTESLYEENELFIFSPGIEKLSSGNVQFFVSGVRNRKGENI